MAGISFDLDMLSRFEAGLDLLHPERGAIPARVLDYGETSTILAIGGDNARPWLKAPPVFFQHGGAGRIGRSTAGRQDSWPNGPACGGAHHDVDRADATERYVVVYVIQEMVPWDTLCIWPLRLSPSTFTGW